MKQNLQYKILCAVMAMSAIGLTAASPALAARVVDDGHGNLLLYGDGDTITVGGDKSDFPGPYFAVVGAGNLDMNSNIPIATGGNITINEGTYSWAYGGYAWEGSVCNNSITINNNTSIVKPNDIISAHVAGGYSFFDDVYSNNIYLNNEVTIDGNVYGGQVVSDGSVFNNNVEINDKVSIKGNVYGGQSDNLGNSSSVTVSGNTVIIGSEENPFEGTIGILGQDRGFIYGGLIGDGHNGSDNELKTGNVTGNKVYIYSNKSEPDKNEDGTLKYQFNQNIYGGYAEAGHANHNEVNINGGTFDNFVYGGYSEADSADSNNININGGYFKYNVYGGSGTLSASDNNVGITGGTFRQLVSGGISFTGSANNNYVDIKNATLYGNISGAVAGTSANGNEVIIDSITTDTGVNIYGAQSTGTATDNTVTINGGTFTNSEIVAAEALVAESNKVIISGGTFDGTTIYAATTQRGTATNNSITITGNANGKNADLSGANCILR